MKTIKTSFLIIAVVSVIIIACKRENGFFENSSTTGSNNLTKLNQPVSVCRNENVDRHFISIQYAFDLINNYQAAAREPGKLCELFSEGGWVFQKHFHRKQYAGCWTSRDVVNSGFITGWIRTIACTLS